MENKISLEASGMPGVIKTMEKHFGKVIEKASRITEPQSEAKVPTSVIDAETKFPVPVLAESKDVASQCGVSADHYQNDDEARESTQISSVGYKAPATDSCGGKNFSVIVGAPDRQEINFSGGTKKAHASGHVRQASRDSQAYSGTLAAGILRSESCASPAEIYSIVGAPDKGRERKPCKTCGLETGYMWAERPEGAVIWCVNTRCVDFHTVFTPEEWEAR